MKTSTREIENALAKVNYKAQTRVVFIIYVYVFWDGLGRTCMCGLRRGFADTDVMDMIQKYLFGLREKHTRRTR